MQTYRLVLIAFTCAACSADPAPYVKTDGGQPITPEKSKTYRYTFEPSGEDALAPFEKILGTWQLAQDDSSPEGPGVLRQTEELNDPDFPRIVLRGLTFKSSRTSVRCKAERGDTDQACGLMFRFRDSDNYYVTRANALEGNVRLYRVVGGARQQFASSSLAVTKGVWHTLEAIAEESRLRVLWDGQQVIDTTDTTFAEGKAGLWTKADSITAFDDFAITEL
jgi:hypothetical protein